MIRYVYTDDWLDDACPDPDPNPSYTSSQKPNKHDTSPEPVDGYPTGDRLKYMQCKRCGSTIWGFYTIHEQYEPFTG